MKKTLKNDFLSIEIDSHGAELTSIRCGNTEYLWQADPQFWARHSPVLFPIVGRVWDNIYHVNGKEYGLPQHGFARDMEFTPVSQTENEIWFSLEDSLSTGLPGTWSLLPSARLKTKYGSVWKILRKLWKSTLSDSVLKQATGYPEGRWKYTGKS